MLVAIIWYEKKSTSTLLGCEVLLKCTIPQNDIPIFDNTAFCKSRGKPTPTSDDVSRGSFKGEPKYNVPVMISRNQTTIMIKYVHIYIWWLQTTNNHSPKLSLIITLWQSWPSQWKFRFFIIYLHMTHLRYHTNESFCWASDFLAFMATWPSKPRLT